MLNNSALKIVEIQKHHIHLGITGDLGDPMAPVGPIGADIQNFHYKIDPTLNVVFVKFWK